MKNFQQNLLIVLAIALCCLCAYQWRGQSQQRGQVEGLNQMLSEQLAAIQGYTNSIKLLDGQVASADTRINALTGTIKTNEDLIVEQKRELNRLELQNEAFTNQIAEYKKVVEEFQARLKEAADGVAKQNEALKTVVAQRDEFVQKLNDSVKERNEVVAKYNDLVGRFEKLQNAKPADK